MRRVGGNTLLSSLVAALFGLSPEEEEEVDGVNCADGDGRRNRWTRRR